MPARPSRIVIAADLLHEPARHRPLHGGARGVGGLDLGRDLAPGEDAVAGHAGLSGSRSPAVRRGGAHGWVLAPAATRSAIAPPSTMSVNPAAAICGRGDPAAAAGVAVHEVPRLLVERGDPRAEVGCLDVDVLGAGDVARGVLGRRPDVDDGPASIMPTAFADDGFWMAGPRTSRCTRDEDQRQGRRGDGGSAGREAVHQGAPFRGQMLNCARIRSAISASTTESGSRRPPSVARTPTRLAYSGGHVGQPSRCASTAAFVASSSSPSR